MLNPVGAERDERVLSVYDTYRSARFNALYYGHRFRTLERWDIGLDVALTVLASGAVTKLAFWTTTDAGKIAWAALAVVSSLGHALKRFLPLKKRLKAYEAQHAGHRDLEGKLKALKAEIEQKRKFDDKMSARYLKIVDKEADLIASSHEFTEDEELKERLYKKVNSELPESGFFVPNSEN